MSTDRRSASRWHAEKSGTRALCASMVLLGLVLACGGGPGPGEVPDPGDPNGGDPRPPPGTADNLFGGVNNGDLFDEPTATRDRILDVLAESGLRVVRIWLDYRLEMADDGTALPAGTYDPCILEAVDDLMLAAHQRGIVLLITLQAYNWISGSAYVSVPHYEWRRCKTPANVFAELEPGQERHLPSPYSQRGWATSYLTNEDAKDAYRERVLHVLNHVNPHFGKAWKDLDEVVWAWGLQNEPEYLNGGTTADLVAWLDEMATWVKSIDPDTYVALGTKYYSTLEAAGCLADVDVYTVHPYGDDPDAVATLIQDFHRDIGQPCQKLLLVEEFNPMPGGGGRTPESRSSVADFEGIAEACRREGAAWMFWEHGYNFDPDDVWHANGAIGGPQAPQMGPDGVFWGAKVRPGARKTWLSPDPRPIPGKPWRVHAQVDALCAASVLQVCREGGQTLHLDTFSGTALDSAYRVFDEDDTDVVTLHERYLRIRAAAFQDLWDTDKRGAPLLLYPVAFSGSLTDGYTAETYVRAGPLDADPRQPVNTQAGLFAFEDADNWIFFGLTNHDVQVDGEIRERGDGLLVASSVGGASQIVVKVNQEDDFAFLAMEWIRVTGTWRFLARAQYDEPWQVVGTLSRAFDPVHEIGVGVKTFDVIGDVVSSAEAHFDFFEVETIPGHWILAPGK